MSETFGFFLDELAAQQFADRRPGQFFAEGDVLRLTRVAPRPDGSGFDRVELTGKRIPALPARPNLAAVKFGAPITLLQANALTGWRLIERCRRVANSPSAVNSSRPPSICGSGLMLMKRLPLPRGSWLANDSG